MERENIKEYAIRYIWLCLFITAAVLILSSCSVSHETVSVPDAITDEHVIDRFYEAYDNLPQWLRDDFSDSGWKISLHAQLTYGGEAVSGLTVYDDKQIYIDANDFGTTKHTVCHEMGHYLDIAAGYPSRADTFADIFAEEYPVFRNYINSDKHISESTSEYWADCCFYYMALPEKLSRYCPETYAYTDRVISDYSCAENIPIAYN